MVDCASMFEAIRRHCPGQSDYAITVRAHIEKVCVTFLERGLADNGFLNRISSSDYAEYFQALSEALVAHELLKVGLQLRPSHSGPDLLIELCGQKIWIEVVCPKPMSISEEHLNPKSGAATYTPFDNILLRWTTAFREKALKLLGNEQNAYSGYKNKGIVGPSDVYVIAINGVLLRSGGFPEFYGSSGFPYAAEATLAVGPKTVWINRETMNVEHSGPAYRPIIVKPESGSPVPANTFLDPQYSAVSAVFAMDLNGAEIVNDGGLTAVVHNFNADTPLPQRLLPTDKEYLGSTITSSGYKIEAHPGRLAILDRNQS